MVMQGAVEVIRCIMCIRTGEWPQRLHDVEELEKLLLDEAEQKKQTAMNKVENTGLARGDI
jgi:hypothetical protein